MTFSEMKQIEPELPRLEASAATVDRSEASCRGGSPMEYVNLKKRFGLRFKVEYEESYHADRGVRTRLEDPWLMIVPCENGHICPWGGSTLAACTNVNGPVANRLRKLSYATVAQDGDDGVNVVFNAKHFDEVTTIMKPRRRRQVSEAERDRLRRMGSKFRFKHGAESRETERPCVQTAPGDSQAVKR